MKLQFYVHSRQTRACKVASFVHWRVASSGPTFLPRPPGRAAFNQLPETKTVQNESPFTVANTLIHDIGTGGGSLAYAVKHTKWHQRKTLISGCSHNLMRWLLLDLVHNALNPGRSRWRAQRVLFSTCQVGCTAWFSHSIRTRSLTTTPMLWEAVVFKESFCWYVGEGTGIYNSANENVINKSQLPESLWGKLIHRATHHPLAQWKHEMDYLQSTDLFSQAPERFEFTV